MRHWLFHPLFFYPVLLVAAVALVFVSLRPDLGPMSQPREVGRIVDGGVLIAGADLAHPDVAPDQVAHVVRDFWGNPRALRLAVLPNQPEPGPAETGARFLLTPEAAAALGSGPLEVELEVRPVEITTAAALAVSVQGAGPTEWAMKELTPQTQIVRFPAPPAAQANAVGLRVISRLADYNYGFEIAHIRITPAAPALRN